MSREKNIFEKFPKKWPKGVFARRVCQYAERDSIGLITPLLLGYSVVTCLPAVHKRDDLKLFACFLISPHLMGGVSFRRNRHASPRQDRLGVCFIAFAR